MRQLAYWEFTTAMMMHKLTLSHMNPANKTSLAMMKQSIMQLLVTSVSGERLMDAVRNKLPKVLAINIVLFNPDGSSLKSRFCTEKRS